MFAMHSCQPARALLVQYQLPWKLCRWFRLSEGRPGHIRHCSDQLTPSRHLYGCLVLSLNGPDQQDHCWHGSNQFYGRPAIFCTIAWNKCGSTSPTIRTGGSSPLNVTRTVWCLFLTKQVLPAGDSTRTSATCCNDSR